MLGNPNPRAYQRAFDYALPVFRSLDPEAMAAASNTTFDTGRGVFTVASFGQELEVTYPEGKVTFRGTSLTPLVGWRLITINYLARANGPEPDGYLISYRELENGHVFFAAFQRESIDPLASMISSYTASQVSEAAASMGGKPGGGSDFTFTCHALPRFPIVVKLWWPDEELPGSANILFDSTANNYLHTEDIAAAGNYASAFLIRLCQFLEGKTGQPPAL